MPSKEPRKYDGATGTCDGAVTEVVEEPSDEMEQSATDADGSDGDDE